MAEYGPIVPTVRMEAPGMATSPEAFNQVRDILKKLDRSIDSARDKRLLSGEPGEPRESRHDGAPSSPNGQNSSHHQRDAGGERPVQSGDEDDRNPVDHQDTPGKARPLRARPMTPRPVDPSDRWSPSGR